MDEERELTSLVTRGFAGMADQLRDRDAKVSQLSDKMIGVELKLDQLKETTAKIQGDLSKSDNERLKIRVETLEKLSEKQEIKQAENAKWIKGLIASVIILLLGFLFNFIRIGLK